MEYQIDEIFLHALDQLENWSPPLDHLESALVEQIRVLSGLDLYDRDSDLTPRLYASLRF